MKKSVKLRGKRTHGYGSHKKHRGAGSRGGRGFAGTKKQKKTWILKHKRSHLGKRGFKSLQQRGLRKEIKAINLKDLEGMGKKEIDLTAKGYDKLLGGGKVTKALEVKVKMFSERAKEKIEKAGGKVIEA
jgi:large subunit ribosomal protein L15